MKDQKTKSTKVQTLPGVITSDKMHKSGVVDVARYVKHPKYGKYYTINQNIKAHDENNEYKVGDIVEIMSTKPISKTKSFVVTKKIK